MNPHPLYYASPRNDGRRPADQWAWFIGLSLGTTSALCLSPYLGFFIGSGGRLPVYETWHLWIAAFSTPLYALAALATRFGGKAMYVAVVLTLCLPLGCLGWFAAAFWRGINLG